MYSLSRYSRVFAAVALALVATLRAAPAEPTDSAVAKAKLAQVRGRIAALTGRLAAELKDRDLLTARLRDADLSITETRRALETLRSLSLATERRRAGLQIEEAHDQQVLRAQRAILAAQVRAAYMIGRQEQIKLLLSQSDPASVGRMVAFYGYFARERSAKIGEIRGQVARVHELVARVGQTTAQLQGLQTDTLREMTQLQHARVERAAMLAAVTRQVSGGTEELAHLAREEQVEESLVAELARVLQDFPIDARQSFAGLRGKLPWPVAGRLATRSQAVRAMSVLIDTTRGAKVRAPCFGRVVYADWLQGIGLLLIIGHSGNYLTLYGHAEVLYKSVGDWVAPGDVIAALSDGGAATPQLYFEIRDGRKSLDPKVWLKATP